MNQCSKFESDSIRYIAEYDTNTTRYVYSPRGIYALDDGTNWEYHLQDGQSSVRSMISASNTVLDVHQYDPIGQYNGTPPSDLFHAYTGEPRDWTGIQYHRARYLSPQLGTWLSLDPFEGIHNRPMSLNGYSWVEGNVINAIDPSGQITEIDCNRTNLDALPDDVQIRCDYARRLLDIYPQSGNLAYWLRFSRDGLRSAWRKFGTNRSELPGEAPAIVPLDYVAGDAIGGGGDPAGSLVQLRRQETEGQDRPLSFAEILAIIIRGEVANLIAHDANIPPSYCMKQRGETDIRIFQNLLRETVERNFKGQCRDDNRGIRGECGAERLIVNTLGGIENFYNRSTVVEGFEDWLTTARDMISRQNIWGYQCRGVGGASRNTPFTWGNTPSSRFPNDPPVVGQENVIDWIDYPVANYKYFVIQETSQCATTTTSCSDQEDAFKPAPNPVLFASVQFGLNLPC